jgi:hypothetical protein
VTQLCVCNSPITLFELLRSRRGLYIDSDGETDEPLRHPICDPVDYAQRSSSRIDTKVFVREKIASDGLSIRHRTWNQRVKRQIEHTLEHCQSQDWHLSGLYLAV